MNKGPPDESTPTVIRLLILFRTGFRLVGTSIWTMSDGINRSNLFKSQALGMLFSLPCSVYFSAQAKWVLKCVGMWTLTAPFQHRTGRHIYKEAWKTLPDEVKAAINAQDFEATALGGHRPFTVAEAIVWNAVFGQCTLRLDNTENKAQRCKNSSARWDSNFVSYYIISNNVAGRTTALTRSSSRFTTLCPWSLAQRPRR